MRAARIDENQPDIVAALRQIGATVQPLHTVGSGCPDLLVGYRGQNFLLEVKNPKQKPSDQRLTPDQVKWHGEWRGVVHIVKSEDDAIAIVSDQRRTTAE